MIYISSLNLQLLTWIFIFCISQFVIGQQTGPENYAAAKGDNVLLKCSWKDDFDGIWYHDDAVEKDKTDIYKFNKPYNPLYSDDKPLKGHVNLKFTASERTAGRYRCHPNLFNSRPSSAEVVVLDPQPTCVKDVKNDTVNATCTIGFSGNWPPEIAWHSANGKLERIEKNSIVNRKATSVLIAQINITDPSTMYTATCSVTFKIEKIPPETNATNVPEFPKTCTLTIGPQEEKKEEKEKKEEEKKEEEKKEEKEEEKSMSSTSPLPPSSLPFYIITTACIFAYALTLGFFAGMPYKWLLQNKYNLK